jgi:hypothetical protein
MACYGDSFIFFFTMKNPAFCDWRRVALVRTDVTEERIDSIVKLLVTGNVPRSPILSILTMRRYGPPKRRFFKHTRRYIPEYGIFSTVCLWCTALHSNYLYQM